MYVDKEHLMLDEICLEPRLVGILEKVLFLAKDYDFKFKKQTLQKIDLTIRTTAGLYLIEYDDDGTVAMEKLLMDADLFRTYIRQDVREMLADVFLGKRHHRSIARVDMIQRTWVKCLP